MSALPIASEIETVVAVVEENPVEAVMAHLDSLETKLNLIAKETLKEAFAEIAALKKALKKAVKAPRAKRTAAKAAGGAGAKGEAPKQVGAWNAFVRDTHELMKSSGWPSFEVTTKKGDTVVYPGGTEEKGIWVVDADEPKKRVVPTYKLAMSYAAYRKANGEYSDPAAEEREAAKAAKTAEKEEAKKLKAAEREAKKAEKEEKTAAAKAAKDAAKATKAEAKPVKAAAKPAAGGAGAKAEEKPKASTKVEAKPVAVEDKEDDEDVENPVVWTHGRKKYFKTPTSHMVWEMNGTKPGAWVGVYDPTTNKIDTSAEEPNFEFE
jgi:hypothetical protein